MEAVEGVWQVLRKGSRREMSGRVATPFNLEDSIVVKGDFDVIHNYNNYKAAIFMPASKQVANADIAFSSIANTRGMLNCTTSFLNITWLRADFDMTTKK